MDLWLIAAAQAHGGSGYRVALEHWLQQRQGDPAYPMRRMDLALADRDWAQTIDALGDVRRIFPDPYWLTVEAWVELQRQHYSRALELSRDAIRQDPSLMQGPDWGLLAALALEQDEEAVRYALILRDQFALDLEALATEAGYERLASLEVPVATGR